MKIKVGAVSYSNTKPLIYGFENGIMKNEIDLILDYPSNIAQLYKEKKIDIALLPVAEIKNNDTSILFSKFCIGAKDNVASVALFSEVSIDKIEKIYLDYQSKTSVALLQKLLNNFWKKEVVFLQADKDYISKINNNTAGLIIGDRALEHLPKFNYVYDLSKAWNQYTNHSFVFATWVSNIPLQKIFIEQFDEAQFSGFEKLDHIITNNQLPYYDLKKYFNENIIYPFDNDMKKGLNLFLSML
ncbi:MAG: menaquinone biosynthesis protein [Chitinophagaceae bacterium]|nr:menaquinone biosynthesis protein [Chitinophagaceae bacterium]